MKNKTTAEFVISKIGGYVFSILALVIFCVLLYLSFRALNEVEAESKSLHESTQRLDERTSYLEVRLSNQRYETDLDRGKSSQLRVVSVEDYVYRQIPNRPIGLKVKLTGDIDYARTNMYISVDERIDRHYKISAALGNSFAILKRVQYDTGKDSTALILIRRRTAGPAILELLIRARSRDDMGNESMRELMKDLIREPDVFTFIQKDASKEH